MLCYAELGGCQSWCIMLSQWLWIKCIILSQWLWIMLFYTKPVVLNHSVLCWAAIGCESWSLMPSHWLWIIGVCWPSGCESWCVMLSQWMWIMVCYSVPLVVNHDELWWASRCESWWFMMSQWLCIMGVFHWANGCASWCAMLSRWLWIKECYSEPVVVNHVVLYWTSGCES